MLRGDHRTACAFLAPLKHQQPSTRPLINPSHAHTHTSDPSYVYIPSGAKEELQTNSKTEKTQVSECATCNLASLRWMSSSDRHDYVYESKSGPGDGAAASATTAGVCYACFKKYSSSFAATVGGRSRTFCSTACRDKELRAAAARAASFEAQKAGLSLSTAGGRGGRGVGDDVDRALDSDREVGPNGGSGGRGSAAAAAAVAGDTCGHEGGGKADEGESGSCAGRCETTGIAQEADEEDVQEDEQRQQKRQQQQHAVRGCAGVDIAARAPHHLKPLPASSGRSMPRTRDDTTFAGNLPWAERDKRK